MAAHSPPRKGQRGTSRSPRYSQPDIIDIYQHVELSASSLEPRFTSDKHIVNNPKHAPLGARDEGQESHPIQSTSSLSPRIVFRELMSDRPTRPDVPSSLRRGSRRSCRKTKRSGKSPPEHPSSSVSPALFPPSSTPILLSIPITLVFSFYSSSSPRTVPPRHHPLLGPYRARTEYKEDPTSSYQAIGGEG